MRRKDAFENLFTVLHIHTLGKRQLTVKIRTVRYEKFESRFGVGAFLHILSKLASGKFSYREIARSLPSGPTAAAIHLIYRNLLRSTLGDRRQKWKEDLAVRRKSRERELLPRHLVWLWKNAEREVKGLRVVAVYRKYRCGKVSIDRRRLRFNGKLCQVRFLTRNGGEYATTPIRSFLKGSDRYLGLIIRIPREDYVCYVLTRKTIRSYASHARGVNINVPLKRITRSRWCQYRNAWLLLA